MLCVGYLYLCIEWCGLLEWEGYVIYLYGYLKQFLVMLLQQVEIKIVCVCDVWQVNNSLVWIKDVKNVKLFWYVFYFDLIDLEYFKCEIELNFVKYMQQFDVVGWFGGNIS